MPGYLSADNICSEKQTVFRSSRKTVSYKEQIMSKDKHHGIFSPQMEAIVFIILKSFSQSTKFWKLGNILGYYPVLAGNILGYYPVLAGNIRSRDVLRPIARERKDLMDYNERYLWQAWGQDGFFACLWTKTEWRSINMPNLVRTSLINKILYGKK